MLTDEKRKEIKRKADQFIYHIIWSPTIDGYDDEEFSLLCLEIISQLSKGWLE